MKNMLIYGICYYYGKNKKSNIINHINSFKNTPTNDKKFVIVVTTNNISKKNNIQKELSKLITNIDYEILIQYNWGGTIAALYAAFLHYFRKYRSQNLKNTHLAFFEEDFGPFNNKWYDDSLNLLNQGYIYIGESTTGSIKMGDDDGRKSGKKYRNSIRLGNLEVWMDGGYYFSSLDKFLQIKNTIGCFHYGNQKTMYDHLHDGIDIGEVGFPTLVYHKGFKFAPLYRKYYFSHEW